MDAATEIPLQLCYPSFKARTVDMATVKGLVESIGECGLLTPITVRRAKKSANGQTIDAYEVIAGLHRVKAFRQMGRETIPAIVLDVDDLHAELMMIDENLQRNDLTVAERSSAQARRKAIYVELHPETAHGAAGRGRTKEQLSGQLGHSNPASSYVEAAADATGQSPRSIRRDVQRGEALGDAALAKVARTSLDKGEELDALAALSEDRRDALIERAAAGEKVSAKAAWKKERRDRREAELGARQRALPEKRYGVIYADPEWQWESWSEETGMDRAAENHYPTSSTEEIMARPVAAIAAEDCVLYLWATVPHLVDALRVMAAWGFAYKSHLVWRKLRVGAGRGKGYWSHVEHELLLTGTRGKPPAPAPGTQFSSVIEAPVGKHSEKPEIFASLIERTFPSLPKIELNARKARPGWDAWGLEAPEAMPPHDPETGEIIENGVPDIAPENRGAGPVTSPSQEEDAAQAKAGRTGSLGPDQEDIPAFVRCGDPANDWALRSRIVKEG